MTPEQLDEIENRQAAAMWIGGPTAAFAQDTLLLVKALREAWEERDKYKAALDAELPAAWREDIESLNSCLERIGKERDVARARLSNLLARVHRDGGHYEEQHGTAKAVEDAEKIVVEDRQAYVSWRDTAMATAQERDEARAEVERLRDIVAVNDQRLADVWDTAKRVLKGEKP